MSKSKSKKKGRVMWGFIYVVVFLTAFLASVVMKMTADPFHGKYTVKWDESVGTVYADLSYGEGAANKFDLYVPADSSRDSYGLAVYLHAGGFTTGDKQDDQAMLQWLCSKGYVAAGINYTLRDEAHPEASVSETCSMSGMPVTSARNAVSVIKSKATPANRWDFLPMDISRTRTIPSIGSLMKKLHKLSGAFLI